MQATPFARLNLTSYACQELQVSFAVGNVAGLSEFSPITTIKIKRDNSKFACIHVSFCTCILPSLHIITIIIVITYTFYTPQS